MPDEKPYTEIGEFNGYPTITVYTGKIWKGEPQIACKLGIKKAEAVLDCMDELRAFVTFEGKQQRPGKNAPDLEAQADEILRNAGENPKAVGSRDGIPF